MNTIVRSLITTAFVLGLASTATAQRRDTPLANKSNKQAPSVDETESHKKSDRHMTVCMECKSVTAKEAADGKEAAALCHNGGSVHCDAGKGKATIKRVGAPGRESYAGGKVPYMYVNGNECMFIVPVKGFFYAPPFAGNRPEARSTGRFFADIPQAIRKNIRSGSFSSRVTPHVGKPPRFVDSATSPDGAPTSIY